MVEQRLIDVVQRKVMSYVLQDLRCVRCRQIKRENMSLLCTCAASFETLIKPDSLQQLLCTFIKVAKDHQMSVLQEQAERFLENF